MASSEWQVAGSAVGRPTTAEAEAVPTDVSDAKRMRRLWQSPSGVIGWFRTVWNVAIGRRMVVGAFIFFLLGGINALLMRTQLAVPDNTFLSPELYDQFFTMHGSTMMYLFAVPILEGFAIMLLPMLLGTRDMAFPRLSAFTFYLFLFGGGLLYAGFFAGEASGNGWFAYVPLSGEDFSPGRGMDFWLMALTLVEISGIMAGVEIIMVILRMRAPGMSISRLPLFAWAMLVTAFSFILAFTPLLVGGLMLELDRKFGTQFYNAAAGGSPILWQHLFWIFGHPEVYIQFIPAVGMVSMIVPVFARRPIVGYILVAMAIVATGFISFGLWVHHMFTVGLPEIGMTFFMAASILIAIPSGVQIFAWITTILTGRAVWRTPFLFVIGFIIIFVLGGITGVMVGSIPFDTQVHDSYFIVAHFHYVLIGGVVFPIFAALYYWLPKFTGRLLDERLGQWHFWLLFIGFNVTFFPMHISGLLGMPRRVYTYQEGFGWDIYNLISTAGAYLIAASILIFVVNFVRSMLSGEPAGPDPWDGDTLEWSSSSPPPPYGYLKTPIVRSRHPLWHQESLEQGDERLEGLVQALARWPTDWRAALTTSLLEGEPDEVFGLAGPSIWPLLAALGLLVLFAAQIWDRHLVSLAGLLLFLLSVAIWHWPQRPPTTREEEARFATTYGVAVRPGGSRAVSRGGMWLGILALAAVLGSLLFSYLFIRLKTPVWPPPPIPPPDLLLPGIAIGSLIASGGAMYWAKRSIERGNWRWLWLGLVVAFGLAAAAGGLLFYDLRQLDYFWSVHAYASLFYVIDLFLILLVLAGLAMNGMVQLWNWRGHYSAGRHLAVQVLAIYWYAMIVMGIVIFAVLFLSPYWL